MQHTYKELCLLNTTHSGEIYLARQEDTGLLVVRKSVEPDSYDLYKRLSQIHHPNLVQVIEVEQQEDACIVIEEYISGKPVAAIVRQNKHFIEKDVRRYLIMLCGAVQTLHENGIIHRDITSNNIILTGDGFLKLCDYDIAKIYNAYQLVDARRLGTPGYAPPEQFGYGQTDERSDIYAIGRVAHVMLAGKEGGIYSRHTRLGKIIMRAVKIDREERYASVKKMEAALLADIMDKDKPWWKFLCFFFGIQTFSPWKMLVVPVAYSYLIYECCLCDKVLSIEPPERIMMLALVLVLIMDICFISRYVLRLGPQQRWFRIVIALGICLFFDIFRG